MNGTYRRLIKGPVASVFLFLTITFVPPAFGSAGLSLSQVLAEAATRRPEVAAADSRARAASARPDIVAALEDPMVSTSVDHWPFDASMDDAVPMVEDDVESMSQPATESGSNSLRADWSVSIEQQFPLSRIRQHRRAVAEAYARKAQAESGGVGLEVQSEAALAFFMLLERRAMAGVLAEQLRRARELVHTAQAHYAAGNGTAPDVLRAELEVSRIAVRTEALKTDIRAAERMLNTAIGRAPTRKLPALVEPDLLYAVGEPAADVVVQALSQRPEIAAGKAEVERADAEIRVMQSMYKPMAAIRLGYASTMAEGDGAMVMFGISLPVWRTRLSRGVDEARAMSAMAKSDLDAMERMVRGEVLTASAQLESARRLRKGLRDDTLPRVDALLDPALAAYASGSGTLPSVLESLTASQMVREEYVMSGTALGLAWVRLSRAIGRFELPHADGIRPENSSSDALTRQTVRPEQP